MAFHCAIHLMTVFFVISLNLQVVCFLHHLLSVSCYFLLLISTWFWILQISALFHYPRLLQSSLIQFLTAVVFRYSSSVLAVTFTTFCVLQILCSCVTKIFYCGILLIALTIFQFTVTFWYFSSQLCSSTWVTIQIVHNGTVSLNCCCFLTVIFMRFRIRKILRCCITMSSAISLSLIHFPTVQFILFVTFRHCSVQTPTLFCSNSDSVLFKHCFDSEFWHSPS